MIRFALLLSCLLVPFLSACPLDDDDDATGDDDDASVDFRVWSPDHVSADTLDSNPFDDCDVALPPEFSCFHPNPEIVWEGVPEGTVAYALIFDDPTAGNFAHWAIYNIPGEARGLDQSISGTGASGDIPDGADELANGAPGQSGYLGSCPTAPAINKYRWRLYALDAELDTPSSASFSQLATDAEAAEIEMVSMCHVFDGADSDF